MAISVRENRENQLESGHLKDAFWLVSEALYEVSKVLNLPAEMLAESMGLDGIRSKYSEIRLIKEEQKLDPAARSLVMGARDDRDSKDRKERDHQHMTLTSLLALNAGYRAAHEAAMTAFADAGNAIDAAIEAGEKALADVNVKIEEYLASTPRLKDGRYVMFDAKDGRYKDENFDVIDEADLTGVKRELVKPILPYERMMEWKDKVTAGLDKQRGRSLEVGEWQNEATNDKDPTKQDVLEKRTESATDYEKDARDAQKGFENSPNYFAEVTIDPNEKVEAQPGSAAIAMPPMP